MHIACFVLKGYFVPVALLAKNIDLRTSIDPCQNFGICIGAFTQSQAGPGWDIDDTGLFSQIFDTCSDPSF